MSSQIHISLLYYFCYFHNDVYCLTAKFEMTTISNKYGKISRIVNKAGLITESINWEVIVHE